MPATQFYVMMDAKNILYSKEMKDLSYVSRASSTSNEGFSDLLHYFHMMNPDVAKAQVKREESLFKQKPMSASSEEAKNRMMNFFAGDRRIGRQRIPVH